MTGTLACILLSCMQGECHNMNTNGCLRVIGIVMNMGKSMLKNLLSRCGSNVGPGWLACQHGRMLRRTYESQC